MSNLPDCAAKVDTRALDIDRVGITRLSYPIKVLDRAQEWQHTVAQVAMTVSLPRQFKGTHMSRFVEILNAVRGEMTIRNIPAILAQMQRRLQADEVHMDLSFPYFIAKRAPVSRAESLMEYGCAFHATKRHDEVDFIVEVAVPVKTLCPCSKSISDRGAHNQRGTVIVQLRSKEFVWFEDIIEAVEGRASSPLWALLKRPDEKWVTEHAYDNPRFVEDLVREVVLVTRELPGVTWLHVSVENEESIHKHNAYAEITWSAGQEGPTSFEPPEADEDASFSFGAWLKQQRQARSLSQAELAEHLGVSPSHLARVESGEKRLSVGALERLAERLGMDPINVKLRAGLVPAELLQAVARDPEGFRAWAD
ncbi:MAG: GTP cyclohydrolase I FolE2 [Deltaproteobacteria bacterium]|nr:GTP cyclohydrolase I FolE2 [Deltaproteobacteria bacterium]